MAVRLRAPAAPTPPTAPTPPGLPFSPPAPSATAPVSSGVPTTGRGTSILKRPIILVGIGVVGLAGIGIGVAARSGGGHSNNNVTAPVTSCSGASKKIFDNPNGQGVQNGGSPRTFNTGGNAYCVTSIDTYHWNAGHGQKPGTIGLERIYGPSDCSARLGPFSATPSAGQGNAPNVNWTVNLAPTSHSVIDGTYRCTDSNPSTWSNNSQSNLHGFCIVYAFLKTTSSGSNGAATTTTGASQPTLAMGPIMANFNQAVFGTFYTVNPKEFAARPIGYSWHLSLQLVDTAGSPSGGGSGDAAGEVSRWMQEKAGNVVGVKSLRALGCDPHRPRSYVWTCKKPGLAGTPPSWCRSHDRRFPPAASGVQSRRGKPPPGRARTSGGFARRANVDDHEIARSCCEPRR